ncbi:MULTISPECIES: hypothetical protein [unclassified Acinetobacter]|uniref:hypothetical protein n=1 Tax=unclassified Acinetobacter TaxID=196816 RepID=UPI002934B76F|nr:MULTISPECIES: hypothetical protein [unclassified Acinetobacter]WOE32272.1 hypothetical protein QSG84_03410 [Acinetobacter sp. SAAs470]WOE37742.1 hypothetical protein QSG86_12455 [Acinetobacter sp. SAAs474]
MVSASLDASGIYPGGKAEGNFSSSIKNTSKNTEVSLTCEFFISGFKNPVTPEKMNRTGFVGDFFI